MSKLPKPRDFYAELERVANLTSAPYLEPDTSRKDWGKHAEDLDRLFMYCHDRLAVVTTKLLGDQEPALRMQAADALGRARGRCCSPRGAGTRRLIVLRDAQSAGQGTSAWPELEASVDAPDKFTGLVHARWLQDRGAHKRAAAVAAAVVGNSPKAIAGAAKTIAHGRRSRLLAGALVAAALVGMGVKTYLDRPEYERDNAVEAAMELASSDPEAGMRRLDELLYEYPNLSGEDQRSIVAEIIRLAAAEVPEPVTVKEMAAVDRFVMRIEGLHPSAQTPDVLVPAVEALERWATQIGDGDGEAVDAQLQVLAMAAPFATPGAAGRLADRRYALGRAEAEQLRQEWPVEAIRRYIALGARGGGREGCGGADRRAAGEPVDLDRPPQRAGAVDPLQGRAGCDAGARGGAARCGARAYGGSGAGGGTAGRRRGRDRSMARDASAGPGGRAASGRRPSRAGRGGQGDPDPRGAGRARRARGAGAAIIGRRVRARGSARRCGCAAGPGVAEPVPCVQGGAPGLRGAGDGDRAEATLAGGERSDPLAVERPVQVGEAGGAARDLQRLGRAGERA